MGGKKCFLSIPHTLDQRRRASAARQGENDPDGPAKQKHQSCFSDRSPTLTPQQGRSHSTCQGQKVCVERLFASSKTIQNIQMVKMVQSAVVLLLLVLTALSKHSYHLHRFTTGVPWLGWLFPSRPSHGNGHLTIAGKWGTDLWITFVEPQNSCCSMPQVYSLLGPAGSTFPP